MTRGAKRRMAVLPALVISTAMILILGLAAQPAAAQTATTTATSTPSISIAAPFEVKIGSSFVASVRLPKGEVAANTFFSWFLDNALQASLSGKGKSSAAFTAPITDKVMLIKVNARLANGTVVSDSAGVVVSGAQAEAARSFSENITNLTLGNGVNLSLSPESPKPSEQVEVSAQSFLSDLNSAELRWLYNGKEVAKGRGLATVFVNAGPAGKRNIINLTATFPNGREDRASLSFITGDVSFYWWADTYVPAWYQGKALPTPGSVMHIQARPTFPAAVADTFTYTWLVNDGVVRSASGPGKSIFTYTVPLPPLPADTISVRISNLSGTIANKAEFILPVVPYEPLAYEEVPLRGVDASRVLERAERSAGKALDILLEPFFVPKTSLTNLRYEWNVNGQTISTEGFRKPGKLTLTSGSDTTGPQQISVSFQDLQKKALRAFKSLTVDLK